MSDSVKTNFAIGSKTLDKGNDNEGSKIQEPQIKSVEVEENLDEEYVDRRSITVALVKNYSLYRKANDKALLPRRDYIGSSINSSTILSSNKEEIETYFPSLLGLAPNNPDFMTRVKQYLNNIQIPVDELGKSFDTTFIYNRKADYLAVKKKEDAIEDKYNAVPKSNTKLLKEALKNRIYELNLLESSKCKLGRPANVNDYLMYRHCLLYNDIAKDMALINESPSIRFYFKDDQKEQEKLRRFRLEVNKAKQNFVACIADNTLFEAMYIQYCISRGIPVLSALAQDDIIKEQNLDKFSTDEPLKFNKLFKDNDIKLRGVIEKLIARGELIRPIHSQNITTSDGKFLGANMNEVVAWFKDPANTSQVNAYHNTLKNI